MIYRSHGFPYEWSIKDVNILNAKSRYDRYKTSGAQERTEEVGGT